MIRAQIAALALAGLLTAPSAFAQAPRGAPAPEACAALEPVLAAYAAHRQAGEDLKFNGASVPMMDFSPDVQSSQGRGWRMAAPSSAALRQLNEVRPINALACPEAAHQARLLGDVLTSAQARAIYTDRRHDAPRTYVQTITTPVLDDDHREAVVRVRVQRNGLGSVENLYLLRKTNAGWRISGVRETPPEQIRPLSE